MAVISLPSAAASVPPRYIPGRIRNTPMIVLVTPAILRAGMRNDRVTCIGDPILGDL